MNFAFDNKKCQISGICIVFVGIKSESQTCESYHIFGCFAKIFGLEKARFGLVKYS